MPHYRLDIFRFAENTPYERVELDAAGDAQAEQQTRQVMADRERRECGQLYRQDGQTPTYLKTVGGGR